jgi:acyl dehydratase
VNRQWQPGDELPPRSRVMTAERMRWYADALETCSSSDGHAVIAPPNIHTDDDIAKQNGLAARVSDGMVSTNWISTLLADTFGDAYLSAGSLKTRYVRPIFEDERIRVTVRITGVEAAAGGEQRLTAEVACLKEDGEVATGGTATVVLPPATTPQP